MDGERGRKNSLFDVAEGEFAENVGLSCVLQANHADSCLLFYVWTVRRGVDYAFIYDYYVDE